MVSARRRNRGQLILVGCLMIALVVIGIGLVINTTLYTESASPALSNVQVDDAATFNLETKRGTRALIHRLNHGPPDRTDLERAVTDAVGNYSELLALSYARAEPASVDVSYDHDDSKIGTRLIQQADGEFDDAIGDHLDPDEQQIGWFLVNVNVSETGAISPFEMRVDGNEGDWVRWEIYRNETGVASNLSIETTHANGTGLAAHCNPRRNRVLIDGMTGTIVADGCTGDDAVFGIDALSAPHDVTAIDRAAEFDGRWELVTNETDALDGSGAVPPCDATSPDPDPTEACHAPVVWTANVTASYAGQDASFVRDRNVSIYGADQ